ncbi:winged helix-turn-helix domain-containing protein [Candidatus Nitrosopelagicus sp.]|nr:winged helix-turn-helix domain-containing protein [Candidatus Nitrosopelagicus sp.]
MRKEIVTKLIKSMPGISYNEIVRDTGLSNGVVSHYIIKLIDSGEIEKEGEKRGKYFTTNILKKDRILITVLRNKTNNEIFKYIMKQTNCNQVVGANKISKKIKKSGSTVSVSLKILQKNNILERVIMNKNSKLTNDIGYRVSNIEVWTKYFIKYNL